MAWEPGLVKFGDGYYQFPRESFDPRDYSRIQADYLLQHTEVRALAAIFIARIARESLWKKKHLNVLKEAGLFFTRPASDLQRQVDEELKRTGKLGFKPDIMKKYQWSPSQRKKQDESSPCPCPTARSASVESLYSDFVSKSTSATTLPPEEETVPLTPTLEEAMEKLVLRALDTGLNTMYAARERAVVYDEAYLCIVRAVQTAVEAKWCPVIGDIHRFIDKIIDDVRRIAKERHRYRKITTDKTPIKTSRLRHYYKGFSSEEYPSPNRKEILETMRERRGIYNRYPKDAFGVYASTCNDSLNESVTAEPKKDYSSDDDEK